ncbi:type I restriction endonuclease subunit R [Paucibacter sp. JuS9]|uniref:type I restriction endonuclease subunit R n=1 Tax=Paucibacter sp. JuS9 TaxID=3228748 RepID=UPI0037579E54
MSERTLVELPFLSQLEALGWTVIDQGEALPTDPAKSLRSDFREVALKAVFFSSVRALNRDASGATWLADEDLEALFEHVTSQKGSLVEANRAVHEMLLKGIPVERKTSTGIETVPVRLIAFDDAFANSFHAINQFRVDTPGQVKSHIRPDLVLLVNGLPLVVVEAKEANAFTSIPMQEAKKQLMRYCERRPDDTKGGKLEGEARLFHANLFLIATTGNEASYGSITTDPDDFQRWKSIMPTKYATFTSPLGGQARQQETLIQGMLPRDTLVDLLQNFVLFTTKGDALVKVVPRYQQYRAILKALDRIRSNTGAARGGVIWHTQGSGKSLTMVFFVRKLRTSKDLFDLKVIMVNDRTDLEDQLGDTVQLTGEKVTRIESSEDLRTKTAGNDSGLYMVMVHKFREQQEQLSPALKSAIGIPLEVPKVKPFPRVNSSPRIIIFIDEAHRTQYSDLGNNLANAFENAIKIAFTGTPLITKRHRQTTVERFGGVIDTYRLKEAQDDEAVLPIIYIGKTTNTALTHKSEFDEKFEDMFAERTAEELEAIKQKYGGRDDILEAEARIADVAKDIVKHYVESVLPEGFKAQVVANSKLAAIRYRDAIGKALDAYAMVYAKRPSADTAVLERIRFLKTVAIVSEDGTNELGVVREARKDAKELDAINNFLKRFDLTKPETGIAFLNVCDMLLTGFDAPIEQVMYLDKPLREHTLLQAIARVNRKAPGKKFGIIVDYIGLTKHLREALDIYVGEDVDEFLSCFRSVEDEFLRLTATFERLALFFRQHKIDQVYDWAAQKLPADEDYIVFELMMDVIADVKQRETFDVLLTLFLQAMNTVLPDARAMQYEPAAKRFAWLKAQARERFKDASLDLGNAGEKVRRLVNEHLVSLGVDPKIPPVELLQANFLKRTEAQPSSKAKASEMEHALRKHITMHMDEDPAFYGPLSEKLEEVIRKYKDNWDEQAKQLKLLVDAATPPKTTADEGLEPKAIAFYGLLAMKLGESIKLQSADSLTLKSLVNDLVPLFRATIQAPGFWTNHVKVAELEGEVYNRLVDTGIDVVLEHLDEWSKALVHLAKSRSHDLLS